MHSSAGHVMRPNRYSEAGHGFRRKEIVLERLSQATKAGRYSCEYSVCCNCFALAAWQAAADEVFAGEKSGRFQRDLVFAEHSWATSLDVRPRRSSVAKSPQATAKARCARA
jgi:hypothetical protein